MVACWKESTSEEVKEHARQALRHYIREAGNPVKPCSIHGEEFYPECEECYLELKQYAKPGCTWKDVFKET